MLAREVVARQTIANQIRNALRKSADARLWAEVALIEINAQRERLFQVPSQSEPGNDHLVVVRPRTSATAPAWTHYTCSCRAARNAACVHRAAVYQWLWRQRFGAVPCGLRKGLSLQSLQAA